MLLEYLVKQYLQTSEPVYLDKWNEAMAGIRKHLIVRAQYSGLKIVAELPHGVGGPISPKMNHLVCFLPGTIALAATGGARLADARAKPDWSADMEAQVGLARDLTTTCWSMYVVTETGLAPEIAWFHVQDEDDDQATRPAWTTRRLSTWKQDFVVKGLDAHNLQRPETVETLFVMWRITGDAMYREWGWKIFSAFEKHTFMGPGKGFTSVNNVNGAPPGLRDNMESFWLVGLADQRQLCSLLTVFAQQAETLKYLYLLFSPDDVVPLDEVVFNTEGHILPRFNDKRWVGVWGEV